jgi:hypothetical protein
MSKTEDKSFLDFLKQVFAPLASLFYVLTVITQFRANIKELGLLLSTVAIFILSVLWAIYVLRNHRVGGASKLKRIGAVIGVFIALIPLIFIIIPTPAPTLKFSFTNETKRTVVVKKIHQFIINDIAPNGFDFALTSGILTLNSNNNMVKPSETRQFICHFANEKQIEELISDGNHFISVRVNISDSIDKAVSSDNMILLNSKNLKGNQFELLLSK